MFKRKTTSSTWPAKLIITTIISFVLLFVIVGLLLALAGAEMPTRTKKAPGLGEIGARCGGPSILPCMPGTVCSVPPERWASEEGVCIKDGRPAQAMRNEGEPCGGENEQCGWGLVCSAGKCTDMITPDKPFIAAVVPEGMELTAGSYRAAIGTKVEVRVHAANVTGGALYLKPMTASYIGVRPEDKASDLVPVQGMPNEYVGSFTVTKYLGADLIAVMQGTDGQDVTLGVNVVAAQ